MYLRPWLFLAAAISAEVTGITVMKIASDSGSVSAMLFMYAMIGTSFYFFAQAVKKLPLALAYATWETLGLLGISIIGLQYFGESLPPQKLLGMVIIVIGVVVLNLSAAINPTKTPKI